MLDLGELKAVDIRKIWANEPRAFTPWLAENIGQLCAALEMELEIVAREADVGDFSLDLLAKDLNTGRHVVIENQFGPTDHDHLGKLITYAAGVDAAAIIWVTETVRDEHRQAIEWLNRKTESGLYFFTVAIEVVQIDESKPAVVFKPIVSPNEWQRAARDAAEGRPSARGEAYRRFFQLLIEELRVKQLTGSRTAPPQNWFSFSSGTPGVSYATSFTWGGRVRVELYIDQGDADRNKAFFDTLLGQREAIESELGSSLEWERLDEKRACRIAAYRDGSIDWPDEKLAEIRDWAVAAHLRFKSVLGPRLESLNV